MQGRIQAACYRRQATTTQTEEISHCHEAEETNRADQDVVQELGGHRSGGRTTLAEVPS